VIPAWKAVPARPSAKERSPGQHGHRLCHLCWQLDLAVKVEQWWMTLRLQLVGGLREVSVGCAGLLKQVEVQVQLNRQHYAGDRVAKAKTEGGKRC